ncbi:hypothetical protein Ppa06_62750 [Planomonospora parontospora subsp. parontospora]|uniref:Aminoglycoside phosphotransferase domain-containing protein n=2 Tax=Planomonospora parontospora TaxID=58119 RepID=A0AA37BMX9_9ACTN|nr:hypothetical protein [Planomonospora parontospora]GGK95239.1 hypothetical protein GCM10010126_63390 [Planomonospora parontospora]GII12477.1 hypothetical protein Ppa06_62750 [Planomonospora parontospora subsp. parontospora]
MSESAWIEAVSRLWPEAEVSRSPRGRRPGPATAGDEVREFVYLPDARRARLLLPLGTPRAAGTALRRYSHDLGVRARLGRGLLSAAVRTGLPQRFLPDRMRVRASRPAGESVEHRLSEILGRRVVVSVSIGNARANRKPVLQAITPSGESLAFVKVGDTDVARELIRAEAAALEELAVLRPPGIRVPRMIRHESWRGLELLVMSALPTGVRRRRPSGAVPVAAMSGLSAVAAEVRTLAGSPFLDRLRRVPAEIGDPSAAARLEGLLDHLAERYGDLELRFGAWHGDWTPWNMAWRRDAVNLWDWERFARDVPAGFDLLHYTLQQFRPTTSWTADLVWSDGVLAALEPFGVGERAARATLALYLTELYARYVIAGQGSIGEPLRPQADALLDLLDRSRPRM